MAPVKAGVTYNRVHPQKHRNRYNTPRGKKEYNTNNTRVAGRRKNTGPVFFIIHIKNSFEEYDRVIKCVHGKCYHEKDIVIWRINTNYTSFFQVIKEYYQGKKYARIRALKFAYKNNNPETKELKKEALTELFKIVVELADKGYKIVNLPDGFLPG